MAIDFALGVFIGVVIVSALVMVAVIILEPSGYQRARPAQAEAGNMQKSKRFSGWKNNPVVLRIMRAWSKGNNPQDTQQRDESAAADRFPARAPAFGSQESNADDVSRPVDDERLNDLINNLKPDEGVKSASRVEIGTGEIGTAPTSRVEEAVGRAGDNEKDNKRGVEMVDIPRKEEDEPPKYSLEEDESHPKEKGDWASAFTDIQAEESQTSKLAKSLGNVEICDLLAQCQSLIKPNRKRKP